MDFYAYVSDVLHSKNNKKITTVSWSKANDLIAFGQENGEINICKITPKSDNDSVYFINKLYTLTDHNHSITSLEWNLDLLKLISADEGGKVIVWGFHEEKWVPLLINDVAKIPIISALSSPNGENIGILYNDGKLLCGTLFGSKKWLRELNFVPVFISWTSHSKSFVAATPDCRVCVLKEHATRAISFNTKAAKVDRSKDSIVGIYEKRHNGLDFLILYKLGTIAVCSEHGKREPIIIKTNNNISCGSWSNNCKSFAVAGNLNEESCYVKFYSAKGSLIRTVELKGSNVTGLCFSPDDTKIALSVDNSLVIVQKVPSTTWTYFSDTIVYAVPHDSDQPNQSLIVYFNTKTNKKHIKSITNLKSFASCNDKCAILSMHEDAAAVIITDANGIPILDKFIAFVPKFVSLTDKICAVSSKNTLCIWNMETQKSDFFTYDWNITALSAKGNTLFIAFDNCKLYSFELNKLIVIGEFKTQSVIESIGICADSTRISAIDTLGFLWFLDVYSGKPISAYNIKSCSNRWSSDSPKLFASFEKQKIKVYCDFKQIDSIYSMDSICEFKDLSILTVDFFKIFEDPINPTKECFSRHQTKPDHDIDLLLQIKAPQLSDEIVSYAASLECDYALNKIAFHALKTDNLRIAEKCFSLLKSKENITFFNQISNVKEKDIRKAYYLWFAGEKEEAIKILEERNLNDLLIRFLRGGGDYEKLNEVSLKLRDRENIIESSEVIASKEFIHGNWKEATKYFNQSGNYEMMLESMFNADDQIAIKQLISQLEIENPLLLEIGKKFLALGSSAQAAEAFLKYGSPQLAADAYVHTNSWKEALNIAEKYPRDVNRTEILSSFAQYLAENEFVGKAMKMLIDCNLFGSTAVYMNKEGDKALRIGHNYLQAKKFYVFASILNVLQMKEDKEEYDVPSVWHKAEALHFLLLAHRLVLSGKYKEALFPASRLLKIYNDILGKEMPSSLLSVAGFNSGYLHLCSLGMSHLENSKRLSLKKRERIEQLSVKMFMKNEPKDPKDDNMIICNKCRSEISVFSPRCKCGAIINCSIASGKPIENTKKAWMCPQCEHYAFIEEIKDLKACPLCHGKIIL